DEMASCEPAVRQESRAGSNHQPLLEQAHCSSSTLTTPPLNSRADVEAASAILIAAIPSAPVHAGGCPKVTASTASSTACSIKSRRSPRSRWNGSSSTYLV